MRRVRIDRIDLAVRGLTPEAVQRLAPLLGTAVARAVAASDGGSRATLDAGTVAVDAGTPAGRIADRVAARVAAQVRRTDDGS